MKRLLMLAVCGPWLVAADLNIDHATVAVSDLKKMQAAMAAVGLQTVYGGAHTNHATEMALISFPDGSYLEFMGIVPNADPQAVKEHVWSKFLTGDAGPCAWAQRVDDMAAEVTRLKAAGVGVGTPERSGRQRPDGVKLQWQTANVGPEVRGAFFPFLIHDFTSRVARTFPRGEPSNKEFRGIGEVVLAVKDLKYAAQRYQEAYGATMDKLDVDSAFGARLLRLKSVPVVLAQAISPDSWIAKRIETYGEGPCAILLSANATQKARTTSSAKWFGAQVDWYDAAALGWHLGIERQP